MELIHDCLNGEIERWIGNSYSHVQWINGSDERIKEDICPIDTEMAVDIIDGIVPKSFKYKAEKSGYHYGMIAQELRKVLNEIGEDEARIEQPMGGNAEKSGIEDQRMINYEEFTALLIAYVKDLRKRLKNVEEQLIK